MKITYHENPRMNHYEIKLVTHPKNKKLVKLLASQFTESLGEIELYDEYRNKYPIPILAVYYFEIVDHVVFAYTEKDVYRLRTTSIPKLNVEVAKFGFYQINARTLVNYRHIDQYRKLKACGRRLVLDNGDVLISTRRFYKEVDKMIEDLQLLKIKADYDKDRL